MTAEEFAKYVPRLTELYHQGYSSERAARQVLAEEKQAGDRYVSMFKKGMTRDEVAREMVSDDRGQVMRAEVHDVDPRDRARIEAAVAYGAKELRIATPKVRFFKSAGFDFRGTTYKGWSEIWVSADLPRHEMGQVALHELKHLEHYADGTPKELREYDAARFAALRRHWI